MTGRKLIIHAAIITAITASTVAPRVFAQEPRVSAQAVELNDENFQQWRVHILPGEGDLRWQQIPWLSTFADGILAADRADKPVLLWTMNGHPLGCT